MKKLITCCCGNRGHAPHLNRIVGVQFGSSRRAGLAPRAHPGPPNAPSPDPTLGLNPGMSLPLSLCNELIVLLMYKLALLSVFLHASMTTGRQWVTNLTAIWEDALIKTFFFFCFLALGQKSEQTVTTLLLPQQTVLEINACVGVILLI